MRTKIVAFIVAFLLLAACATAVGCGGSGVGTVHKTKWFEFTIHSIEKVDSYAGYTPRAGYQLYDVVITEKNTFSVAIEMGTFDFYMDDPSFIDYIFPIDPLNSTMMPEVFTLGVGQSVQYHMVFEIPSNVTKLKLMYTEIDEFNNKGKTFTIDVNKALNGK